MFAFLHHRFRGLLAPSPQGMRWYHRIILYPIGRRITPTGRALLVVFTLACFVAASLALRRPVYLFASYLLAMLLVGRIAQLIYRPRVRIRRALPDRCAAGVPVEIRATVQNLGRLPVFDLGVGEQSVHPALEPDPDPVLADHLPADGTVNIRYRFTPNRRGVYDLRGPVAFTAFPLGIYYQVQRIRQPHRLMVHPGFTPLADLRIPTGRKHQPGGLQLVSQVGDSEEFHGNREYRPGDRLRDIHHASWARVGYPVVREFRQEYLTRIGLVLDTFVPWRAVARDEALEAALSLGAAVADHLGRRDYVVDLFAAGPDLYRFQSGRSLAYIDNILDILACLEACRRNPFATLTPALLEDLGRISTVVALLLDWDETRAEFVRELQRHGVVVKVLLVREGPPTLDVAGAATEAGPIQSLTPAAIQAGGLRL